MERSKKEEDILFLDFDGVICDSVDECFVSSWLAYAEYSAGEGSEIPLSVYALFRKYRPLIRRGGDYLLLQQCIDRGIPLANQGDFDRQADTVGAQGMDEFHRLFYKARTGLLENDRRYWLGLHRIYSGLFESLAGVTDTAWILTTKEVGFVHEILLHNRLPWEKGRIICSGKERKLDVIDGILHKNRRAVFVDDQIDHFSNADGGRVSCFLAAWGYIQPEWLRQNVPVLTKQDFVRLVGGS